MDDNLICTIKLGAVKGYEFIPDNWYSLEYKSWVAKIPEVTPQSYLNHESRMFSFKEELLIVNDGQIKTLTLATKSHCRELVLSSLNRLIKITEELHRTHFFGEVDITTTDVIIKREEIILFRWLYFIITGNIKSARSVVFKDNHIKFRWNPLFVNIENLSFLLLVWRKLQSFYPTVSASFPEGLPKLLSQIGAVPVSETISDVILRSQILGGGNIYENFLLFYFVAKNTRVMRIYNGTYINGVLSYVKERLIRQNPFDFILSFKEMKTKYGGLIPTLEEVLGNIYGMRHVNIYRLIERA